MLFRSNIAPESCEAAGGAGGGVQPLGDVLQHPVAEAVTEGVVDRLEVVDVDEQQRQALPAAGARERALELRGEVEAVEQLRQRIVVRKVMELDRKSTRLNSS